MDDLLRGILIGLLFGLPVGAVGTMTVQHTLSSGIKAGFFPHLLSVLRILRQFSRSCLRFRISGFQQVQDCYEALCLYVVSLSVLTFGGERSPLLLIS